MREMAGALDEGRKRAARVLPRSVKATPRAKATTVAHPAPFGIAVVPSCTASAVAFHEIAPGAGITVVPTPYTLTMRL